MVNKRKVGGRPKRKQNIARCPKVITEHINSQFLPLLCVPWMILCVEVVITSNQWNCHANGQFAVHAALIT